MIRTRRWFVLAGAGVVGAGAAAAIAFSAAGSRHGRQEANTAQARVGVVPSAVARMASQEGVTDIGRVGPAAGSEHLGFYFGIREGERVVTVGSSEFVGPFVPASELFRNGPLVVQLTSGGSKADRVDYANLVGIASPSIARVTVFSSDGNAHPVELEAGAFAYSAATAQAFAARVTGYNASGDVVAERAVDMPAPPG